MGTTATAYLTGFGRYLPGDPVDDGIAARLGGNDPVTERIRRRVLEANGIRQRHYALDEDGEPNELNEELAVKALLAALDDRGIDASDVRMLACATTMGDVLVPGFASMVHGCLGGGPMQLLSASGVCASSLAALDAAVSKIRLGDHLTLVAHYLDTSALVKLAIDEAESSALVAWLTAAERVPVTSDLARTELLHAFEDGHPTRRSRRRRCSRR